jgi:hypothetical protein
VASWQRAAGNAIEYNDIEIRSGGTNELAYGAIEPGMKTSQKTATAQAPPAAAEVAPVLLPPTAIPAATAPPASNGNGAPPAASPAIAPVKVRTAAAAVESVASATSMAAAFKYWFMHDAPTWLASAVIHMVLFLAAALILGTISY